MEWPKELLEIFEDTLLDDVRPKAASAGPEVRMGLKLEEIARWVEVSGRLPQDNGLLKERLLHAALKALRLQKNERLASQDRLGLLDEKE